MKTHQLKLVCLLAVLFGVGVTAEAKPEKKTVTFSVNIHCENCKQKIERNLAYEKGVLDLKVDLKEKTVAVTYDAAKTSEEKLTAALKKLGYEVKIAPEKTDDRQKTAPKG